MCPPFELSPSSDCLGPSQADADLITLLADPTSCGALKDEFTRLIGDQGRAEAVIEQLLKAQIEKLSLLPLSHRLGLLE